MTTVAQARAEELREPVWVLKLTLDYCTRENGVAPCAATVPCRFTWHTCKDTANYDRGSRVYSFCNRGAAVPGARPLLVEHGTISAELRPDDYKTTTGEMRFTLAEDLAAPLSDPTKTTGQAEGSTVRFWPVFLKRNPNYHLRGVELYRGYANVAPADFTLYWRGVLEEISLTKSGAEIRCLDLFWKTEQAMVPGKVAGDVVLAEAYAGENHLHVNDTGGFKAATANEPRMAQVEDEYFIYTGINPGAGTLTGVTRGAFGTTAANHAAGAEITPIQIYAANDAATWNGCSGVDPDLVFHDLLGSWAEISPAHVAVYDPGITLNGDHNSSVTTLTLSSAAGLPGRGVVLCGTEWIPYTSHNATQLLGCTRGRFGSTAAAHSSGAAVALSIFSHEIQEWKPGLPVANRLTDSAKVEDQLNTLRRSLALDLWQDESGDITCRFQRPPLNPTDPPALSTALILDGTREVLTNEERRITRVYVYFKPLEPDAGESPETYQVLAGEISAESENAVNYGEKKEAVIFAPWLRRLEDAAWLAGRVLLRFETAPVSIKMTLDPRDDDKGLGDLVRVTVPEVVDEDGAPVEDSYQMISKRHSPAGLIEAEVMRTGFENYRYGLIPPASLDGVDWDDWTDAQQRMYFCIGNANNKLGAALEDGFAVLP